MPTVPWKWILFAVVVGVAVIVLYRAYRDGFQTGDATANLILADATGKIMEECLVRETCSECLVPDREISPPEDATKTPAQRCADAGGIWDGINSRCIKRAVCGWCSGSKKCVPRVGSITTTVRGAQKVTAYPVVPRVALPPGAPATTIAEPQFQCPIDTFQIDLAECEDLNCGAIKNCRECAMSIKCGWCASKNKCLKRGAQVAGQTYYDVANDAGDTCLTGADVFVSDTQQCPWRPCSSYTDCEECAKTPGCAYCAQSKKCLQIAMYNPTDLCSYKGGALKPNADRTGQECRDTITNALIDITQSLQL